MPRALWPPKLPPSAALPPAVEDAAAGAGAGGGGGGGRRGGGGPTVNFMTLNGEFGSLMNSVEQSDNAPTQAMQETYHDTCQQLTQALTQWEELKTKDVAALNAQLAAGKIAAPPP